MPLTIDNELGEAALRAAAKAGFPSVVDGLLKAGVNPDAMFGAALVIAEQYGDTETIDLLREKTTSMEELFKRAETPIPERNRISLTIDNELGEAALRAAAKAGFPSVAQGLLDAGVDPNAWFGAALVIAKQYGDAETIDLLRRRTTSPEILFEEAQSSPRTPETTSPSKKTRSPTHNSG